MKIIKVQFPYLESGSKWNQILIKKIYIHVSLILNLKMKILRFALQNNHLTQISQIHADFSLTKLFFWLFDNF
ncbi:MAG: hypothetical protein AB8G11_00085, partial [Saprospiraceae bacterium]